MSNRAVWYLSGNTVRLLGNGGVFGAETRSGGRSKAKPVAWTWMSAQGSRVVLGDAPGGLMNDAFWQQVLVCQRFKAYVNWFSEVAALGMG